MTMDSDRACFFRPDPVITLPRLDLECNACRLLLESRTCLTPRLGSARK